MGFDSRRLTVPPLNRVVVQLRLSWLWASIERESMDFVLSVGLDALRTGVSILVRCLIKDNGRTLKQTEKKMAYYD